MQNVHGKLPALNNKDISIFGWAFKKNTNDSRESASIYVSSNLLLEGANLKVYDPQVSSDKILNDLKYLFESKNINNDQISALLKKVTISRSIEQNAKNSNALVFLTEWDEFKIINFRKLYKSMVKPSFGIKKS